MRIAVVTTSYPAYDGDPAGHFVAAEVAELRAQGDDVTVIAAHAGGAFGWPGAAARLREKPWRALDAGAWAARAAVRLRAARPERVVAHWCVPSAWPIASAVSAELAIVSHGADVRLLVSAPRALRASLVTSLAKRASSWRFVSASLRDELTCALPGGATRALERIAVVGASPLGMIDVRDASRERRAALEGRPLYVCAGRLVASKRVDKVIDYVAGRHSRAVGASAGLQPDLRADAPVLVVLGDGPERPHLEKLAQRWRLDARFLGTTPRHEALAWIGAADELVHASRAEGLSTVVREAEELGVPVTILS
jgi:glycosyltransferase involved in cell wall biosynthesis